MRPTAPAAALLLASAAALPAQSAAPRDSAAREARETRRDTIVREYTVRRVGPGEGGSPGIAGGFVDAGPNGVSGVERVDVFRARAESPRSAVGLYLGAADASGLRVERVAPDGPAAKAGLAAGDRLTAVAGTSLRVDAADAGDPLLAAVPARRLERAVARLAPGSEVELRVARDGRERAVRLRTVAPNTLADAGPTMGPNVRTFRVGPGGFDAVRDSALRLRVERFGRDFGGDFGGDFGRELGRDVERGIGGPGAAGPEARARRDSARARAAARPVLGLTLDGRAGPRDTLGVFVSAVARGGPAERAGVAEGDRIAQVNAVDLRVPGDEQGDPQAAAARRARLTREVERLRAGDRVTLRVYGDGRWRTVTAAVARAGDVYGQDGPTLDGAAVFGPGAMRGLGTMRGLRVLPRLRALPSGPAEFVRPGAFRPFAPPLAPRVARPARRVVRV